MRLLALRRRASPVPSLPSPRGTRGAIGSAVLALAACALTTLTTRDAGAQADLLVPRPPRIVPPARPLATTDDSDALALDAANIAFLPSWELRYNHVHLPGADAGLYPGRGDSIGFATPLLFGLATGARLDLVRPPSSAPLPRMTAFTWALALKLADFASIAIDIRRWYSDDLDALDGATSIDVAYTSRPSPYLGFAFVARDLNAPRGRVLAPDAHITRSFDFGVAVRPFGTRVAELDLEATVYGAKTPTPYDPDPTSWSPRAVIGVDIPRVGRLQASATVLDPRTSDSFKNSWVVSAGIDIGLANSRYGGGVIVGKGLRNTAATATPGWWATASIAGYEEPGIQLPARGVMVRIDSTPGARGHVHLLRKLARLGRDPTVRAVALVMKAEPAASTAHAEELADAIASLQQRGVRVLCHVEDGGGKALLACATADRILVTPAGGIRFAGFRSEQMYFGDGLRKIGVEPDFVRIKEHKTAPEEFVRSGPTDVSVADTKEMLESIEAIYLDRLSKGRRIARDLVRANIAKGPYIADEAIAAGFVDAKAFDDEIPKHIREVVGGYVRVEEDDPPTKAPKRFGPQPHLAIVYLDGDIVDGESQTIPLLGTKLVGSRTMAAALKEAREDPMIAGVILRIESPGGSSLASDVMWREAELLFKSGKPVIVSMGSVAASGGYYAAAFGAPIFANRATITGSIGIFYGKADVSGLLDKLGVRVVTQKTAPHADAESLYRPFTDEERVELRKKVGQFYAVFLERVARGRHMQTTEVDAVGRGKVWLGDAAKAHHLVDEVAGIDVAIARLREQLDIPVETSIEELPVEKNGLLDLVLSLVGVDAGNVEPSSAAKVSVKKLLGEYADSLAPFLVFRSDEALALWDGVGAL